MADMCPHCGAPVIVKNSLTVTHSWPIPTRQVCPGSGQNPRCAESDARPLWNGERNPHIAAREPATTAGAPSPSGEWDETVSDV